MKKPRIGPGGGGGRSSREDAEREAKAELARLTRGSQPPPGMGGGWAAPSGPSPARAPYRPPAAAPRRSSGPVRESARSPGTGRSVLRDQLEAEEAELDLDADEEGSGSPYGDYDDDDGYDEYDDGYDDEDGGYSGPRNAREEEEAVTELALRDWAVGRGRIEDVARPRIDPTSVEAQRDRALKEILERQERMRREYQEQRARLEASDNPSEVSDIQSAHLMNVLRRGKPPGMMNMAAAQTGAFNRQRTARATAAAPAPGVKGAAKPAKGKATKAAKPAPAKAKPAKKPAAAGAVTSKAKAAATATRATPAGKAPAKSKAPTPPAPAAGRAKAAPAPARGKAAPAAQPTGRAVAKPAAKAGKASAAASSKPSPRPTAGAKPAAPTRAARATKAAKTPAAPTAAKAKKAGAKKAKSGWAADIAAGWKSRASDTPTPRKG